jgi:hypothetical protein
MMENGVKELHSPVWQVSTSESSVQSVSRVTSHTSKRQTIWHAWSRFGWTLTWNRKWQQIYSCPDRLLYQMARIKAMPSKHSQHIADFQACQIVCLLLVWDVTLLTLWTDDSDVDTCHTGECNSFTPFSIQANNTALLLLMQFCLYLGGQMQCQCARP